MAKPDCEDGWIPYAHELDAALAVADFTKGARIVLREAFGQIFGIGPVGKTKLRAASLSPSDIARRTGLLKRQVVRSIEDLVLCHVLRRIDRGLYGFVKDYERWTRPDGSPRLSKVEIAYCASAATLAKTYVCAPGDAQNTGAQIDPKPSRLGAQIDPGWGRRLTPAGGANGPQLGAQIDPENAAPYRNGRGELEIREGLEGLVLPDQTGGGRGDERATSIEDLIAEARRLHNPDVARQVAAKAADILEAFGDRLDCYLSAIREAADTATTIREPHRWFLKVGKEFLAGTRAPRARIEPQKSKGFDEAASRLLDDPEFNRFCDGIPGA